MSRAFVAYSRSDAEFAERLINRVKKLRLPLWRDVDNLVPGEAWQPAIDRAIREADVVFVIVSPRSVKSHYVTYEWAFAVALKKTVVPLIHEQARMHRRLEDFQYVDLTKEKWVRLAERLARISEEQAPAERIAGPKPQIHAQFSLFDGKPVKVGAKRDEYAIELHLRNLPRGAKTARFEIHDDTFTEPVWTRRNPHEDFATEMSSYGDILLSVDVTGRHGTIRVQDTLFKALKRTHRSVRNDYIKKALRVIEEN